MGERLVWQAKGFSTRRMLSQISQRPSGFNDILPMQEFNDIGPMHVF